MFSLTAQQQYFLYSAKPPICAKVLMGLAVWFRNELDQDPLSGDVFIFVNRRRNRMKLLVWESSGFVLYYKQLEQGTFEIPEPVPGALSCAITWRDLVLILEGVLLSSIKKRETFFAFQNWVIFVFGFLGFWNLKKNKKLSTKIGWTCE